MSMQAADTSVGASVVVEAPIERAFALFTEGIGSWWDPDHHLLEGELAEMVFEPRVGGHVYDRGVDGSECRWARVLAFEPPHRFVISWDINTQWELETDLEKTSEVEVRFLAEAPGPDARRARAPQPRAPRRRLGADARLDRLARRLELRPAAVRGGGRRRLIIALGIRVP